MMFIAAVAFLAMSCGNKAANTEAATEEVVVEEEVVVADSCEAVADTVVVAEVAE